MKPSSSVSTDDESSVSAMDMEEDDEDDDEDERPSEPDNETPDLYRNSALGM